MKPIDWNDYPPEGATDPDHPPAPEECRCGAVLSWSWWSPGEKWVNKGYRARWCAPAISPCSRCAPSQARLERDLRHRERQRRAGVPRDLRHLRLSDTMHQEPDEHLGEFMRRVKGSRLLGVTLANAAAFGALKRWNPCDGGWLFLHGDVGSGKTALASAKVSQLLEVGDTRWEGPDAPSRPGERTMRRQRGWDARLVEVGDLAERDLRGSTTDRDPVGVTSRTHVLVLDDLGVEQDNGGWEPERATQRVCQLVRHRHRARLPTIITSNLAWETVSCPTDSPYGARVADRLRELVTDVHCLGLTSWRAPPALEREAMVREPEHEHEQGGLW